MRTLVYASCWVVGLAVSASAATGTKAGADKPAVMVRPVSTWTVNFNVGGEVEYMKYEEPDVMKETGFQLGVFGEVILKHNDDFVIKSFMSLVGADLDYDGSVQHPDGTETPFKVSTPNTIFNLRGTCGYKLPSVPYELTPYAGLGYRYLYNDLASDRPEGYKRYQHYFYLPVGIEATFELSSQWKLVPRAEFDLLLVGKNKSLDAKLTQKSGWGFRASCDVLAPEWLGLGLPIQFDAQPFFEYWNVADSDTVGGIMEPKNNTIMGGLRLSVLF